MARFEETKAFLEAMLNVAYRLRGSVDLDFNGQWVTTPSKGLEEVQAFGAHIDGGWRVDPDAERVLFPLEQRIYCQFQNAGLALYNQSGQASLQNSIVAWRMLKEAGCRPFFEVFNIAPWSPAWDTSEQAVALQGVREVLENLADDIFEVEATTSPQHAPYAIKGLMKRAHESRTLKGKHPFEWAKIQGLSSIPLKEFWMGLRHFESEKGAKQFKGLQALQKTLEALSLSVPTPILGERFLPYTNSPEIILKEFSGECFPLLAKWGFDFNTMHPEIEQNFKNMHPDLEALGTHTNVFFCLASFGHKDISAKIQAALVEVQKKDPSKSVQDWLNAKDDQGATLVHFCAKNRDFNALQVLQKLGADFKVTDNKGNTPIHWMMKTYSVKHEKTFAPLLTWLRDQGIDFEAKNKKGEVAFQKLAKQGSLESLLSAIQIGGGALLKEANHRGETGLDMLSRRSDKDKVLPVAEKVILDESLRKVSEDEGTPATPKRRI